MPESAGFENLQPEECRKLLATATVGRIAFTDAALPAIRPVGFAFIDGAILVRTPPGSMLDAALDNTVVAFEVDQIDLDSGTGWDVCVVGRAEVVTSGAATELLAQVPSLGPSGPDDQLIRILVDVLSGRRVS